MPETVDFIIVGSGAGSVPAALAIKEHGRQALIIEKQRVIGGTSAFSGGVLWIPNNDHLNAEGGNDSHECARTYLDGLIGDVGTASSPERRDAFIREGAQMVRFLEHHGMKFIHAHFPDYYDTRSGGIAQGRSLTSPLFDVKTLGEWAPKLANFPLTSLLPITSSEAVALFLVNRTWGGKQLALKIAARMVWKKITGKELRGSGNALQGRLFQIALREKVPIWTDTPIKDFVIEGGRVIGVIAEREGRVVRLGARLGVLLNVGGFSHNLSMREQYQPKPTSVQWTQASPGDTGEMIRAAMALGAQVDLMDQAVWLASSFMPDGKLMGFHSPNDIGKPHCIVVDAKGRRFANESNAYVEFGQRMYAAGAVPAWAIFDDSHRRNYPWGTMLPGRTPSILIDRGYITRAASLEQLAHTCGIDPKGLVQNVSRFNEFARTGVDVDFGRGASAYNRYYGDPTVEPNPNLGAIQTPPFYSVVLQAADVGTFGGLMTDEFARVLRNDGSVIAGLYATGNCTASVMGRCYPGAGASIGPSMTFGYIAAGHAVRASH